MRPANRNFGNNRRILAVLFAVLGLTLWSGQGHAQIAVCQVDPSGTYIEAENFSSTIVQGTASFVVQSNIAGFNGSGFLRSVGGGTPGSPSDEGKIYRINFTTPGTYNVWMRGYALDGASNSAFIGLNGSSVGALTETVYNTWTWTNTLWLGGNQISVPSAGFHDFNTWVREANHRIDGFYITQGGETPSGGIPAGKPVLDPTLCVGTALGNGTDPANAALAPGGAATMADAFTFQTSTGSDSITNATVTMSAGSAGGLSLIEITNDAGTVVYGSVANPATDTPNIALTGLTATTSATQYKIRVTPKSHAAMPAPAGSVYSVTARISGWTGNNTQVGADSAGTTVTIDNLSPGDVTGATATAGNGQVSLTWTNPGDADLGSIIVLRSTSAVVAVPTEGAIYSVGNSIGASTVACVVVNPGTSCTDTGLSNGTAYYYRIFTRDSSGNYSTPGAVPSGSPATPAAPPATSCQVDPSGTYIEAENFSSTIVQGTATFVVQSDIAGFNGSGFLRSVGGGTGASPSGEGKNYHINFTTPGTYNVWMRGYALDGASDSAFIGLNGSSVGALNEGGTYNTWVWTNSLQLGGNQISVPSAGFHDFNTWVREANHRIDGFYITQGGETPSGGIPAGKPVLDPTLCVGTNLALTKADSADPVAVGNRFDYTLTVSNNGPDVATNVTVIDTLPVDVDFDSATPSQGSCMHSGEPTGGTLTCTLGTLANGSGATITIAVDAPNTTGSINNSATVSANEADPDTSDNTANESTTIIATPNVNLSLTMNDSPDPMGVDGTLTYSLTVTNGGAGDGTDVTLVDTLPATAAYQSAAPSQGSCIHSGEPLGGTVTCTLGAIANGANASIDILVTAPAAPTTLSNSASVSGAEPDPNMSNNTASEDTTVLDPAPADLALSKGDSPDPVSAGATLTYTLIVDNLGPGNAPGTTLADTLPATVAYQSATPSQGICVHSGEALGGTVDCTLNTITNGASATVVIVVTAPATSSTITNNASVTAVVVDGDNTNNAASQVTSVTEPGDANLSLTKSDSPDPVRVNGLFAYTLDVVNLGPEPATGVSLVDTLPGSVAFQSVTPSQGNCSHSGGSPGGTVTCNLNTIAMGASATVDIVVRAPASAGTITNTATVSAIENDQDLANNDASENTTVENLNTNQLCYLVADAGGGNGGNDLLTRIDTADFNPVTNETSIGTGTGTNSIEAIAWHAATGVLYAANANRLGTLNLNTGVFNALPSTFGSGNGAIGSITFSNIDGLAYDSTTGVLYGTHARGGSDVLIQINMSTGARIPNAFGAGVDYVVIQPIAGNDIVDDIAIDPTTGVMYASTNSGGNSDLLVTINKATGATASIGTITVPDIEGLGTDATGQLWGTSGTQGVLYEIDKASGTGSNGRPIDNGSDYEAVDCFALSPSVIADLAVTKTVNNPTPAEGSVITYTVSASNNGPSGATVVQLSDVLPAGVSFVSATRSQGGFDSASGNWYVGSLASGQTATLTINASVGGGTGGTTITNTASVLFLSQNDLDSSNDTDSVDIDPSGAPDILVMKTVSTFEDPFNGMTNPKAIPGATVLYSIQLTNLGTGPADADSVTITEQIPPDLSLRVLDFDGATAGPVAFVDGTPASGHGYNFVALGDGGDGIEFSSDGGTTYTYVPVADGQGVDPAVTHIRIRPSGPFNGSGGGSPNYQLLFKAVVK